MKNLLFVTTALALASGFAVAQTANTTAAVAINPYIGTAPVIAYVSATLTSTTQPVAAALPVTNKTINSILCNARDTAGNDKPINITVSSTTNRLIFATAAGQPSATIAVGDRVNCVINYER